MSYDVKATTFVFPHEKLTKIDGIPTHETVTLLRKELYANAYENDCTLGGGNHGYLGIIMPDDKYEQLQRDKGEVNPTAFVRPAAPNLTDTAVTILNTNKAILDYKTMEAHLKQQIHGAVHREYFTALDDDELGIGQVTAKALLAYLTKKYDVITYNQLSANRAKLEEPWDASEPIHKLWNRTQQVLRYAKAGNKPIDEDTAMNTLLNVLQDTGVFATHITIWKQKPANTWTMAAFQEFFDEANKERATHTAKEAGYANAVKGTPKSTTATANAAQADSNTAHDKMVMIFGTKKIYYCWSHGGSTNEKHTSITCNRPKDGHISLATWDNTCGGCTDMLISEQNRKNRYRGNNNSGRNGNNNRNNSNGNNNNNGSNGNNSSNNNNNGNNNSNSNSNNNGNSNNNSNNSGNNNNSNNNGNGNNNSRNNNGNNNNASNN